MVYFTLSIPGPKAQTPRVASSAPVTDHSQDLRSAEEAEVPVGDRWDDEDWGSLEVIFSISLVYIKTSNMRFSTIEHADCVIYFLNN